MSLIFSWFHFKATIARIKPRYSQNIMLETRFQPANTGDMNSSIVYCFVFTFDGISVLILSKCFMNFYQTVAEHLTIFLRINMNNYFQLFQRYCLLTFTYFNVIVFCFFSIGIIIINTLDARINVGNNIIFKVTKLIIII